MRLGVRFAGRGGVGHAGLVMAAQGTRFQESAAPRLQAWGARALYLGPALNLSPHRNAVAVLALGLDSPFGVANDPADPQAGYRPCRSVLIPPDTLHHLAGTVGIMAFLYVDPCSLDLPRLWAQAREATPRAGFDLAGEAALIALLGELGEGRPWAEVRPALETWLGGRAGTDARVRRGLDLLHRDAGARVGLKDLAAAAGLSDSRFRHLFKAATGVPVRRYRIWIAMGAAMRAIARGESLTTAALDAGFSSSAHFSAGFREMFGLEPSRLARGGLTLG